MNYTISLTSALNSFVTALAETKLEDLATGSYADAWDHTFTIENITNSWTADPSTDPYFYPLINYGQTDDPLTTDPTINGTSWIVDNFRPCLYAKTYIDLIFNTVGWQYTSSFFGSQFFGNIIYPFCDESIIPDQQGIEITSDLNTGSLRFASTSSFDIAYTGSALIFDTPISGTYSWYSASLYNISSSIWNL